jgi:hypothetical protein
MNHVAFLISASVVVAAASCGLAQADSGKTREQVRAEYLAARQAGDIHEGETGTTQRESFPRLYPADSSLAPNKSRALVRAELSAALRAGTVVTGEDAMAPRDLFPADYPPATSRPGKTREQVRAELAAAQRAGLVITGLYGLAPRELFPGDYADTNRAGSSGATMAHANGQISPNH